MQLRNLEYINESLYSDEINGLKIYIMPKKGFSKIFTAVSVNYGSNDIKFSINGKEMREYPLGIAHFLEHKLFEEKDGSILDKFSVLGSSPNAFTNFNQTSYYFNCTHSFEENFKLLLKFVFNPYFSEESVEKEKGIIEQEIKMYQDNPQFKVFFNLLQSMYRNHPVRHDIAGTVESIHKITPQLLYECYNAFYVPQNMILVVTGDVVPEKIIELSRKLIPLKKDTFQIERNRTTIEKGIVENYKYEKMNLSIPNFIIGFKDDALVKSSEVLRKKIEVELISKLLFSRSADLFEELYNSGLINENFEYDYTCEREYGHFIIGGESKDPQKVKDIILKRINKFVNDEITDESFNRITKALIGSYLSIFNSIDAIGNSINDYSIRNIDIFEYLNILKSFNKRDIKSKILQIFDESKLVFSVID